MQKILQILQTIIKRNKWGNLCHWSAKFIHLYQTLSCRWFYHQQKRVWEAIFLDTFSKKFLKGLPTFSISFVDGSLHLWTFCNISFKSWLVLIIGLIPAKMVQENCLKQLQKIWFLNSCMLTRFKKYSELWLQCLLFCLSFSQFMQSSKVNGTIWLVMEVKEIQKHQFSDLQQKQLLLLLYFQFCLLWALFHQMQF